MFSLFTLQSLLLGVFYGAIFIASVWALIDAARRPASAFTSAGKRTKGLWVGVLAAAAVVGFIAIPFFSGSSVGGSLFSMLALGSAVVAIVYLVDVRPAVAPYSRRRGGPSNPGGW